VPHGRVSEAPNQKVVWTPAELRMFLSVAAAHRLGAFYRLAVYTGARRGELLHLRWSDIDLDAAEVTFRGSTDVIDGERVDGTTKGDRSRGGQHRRGHG
jgi:integrase